MRDDLYTELLGIPPGPRPPDHYTLLGLPLRCDNAGEIARAATARLEKLDEYALHPDRRKREAAHEMMNRVARARMCLGDPEKKRRYDRTLQSDFGFEERLRQEPNFEILDFTPEHERRRKRD